MAKYGMVIDINRCSGCFNCFLACRDEYVECEYPGYSAAQPREGQFWIKVNEKERGQFPKVKVNYIPILCNQCDKPACLSAAEDGAVYRRDDGIIMIDPVKAKGQKQIVNACPYRVITWNEALQLPQKCTFCAHLLDKGGREPRCVEACPTDALVFGDLSDLDSKVSRLLAAGNTEPLHTEFAMKEKVTYIGLPKKFVAGTVVSPDKQECIAGATVTLTGDGKALKAETNFFGDFEFEGLKDNAAYTVKVEKAGYAPQTLRAETVKDVYLGEIVLKK